MKSSSHLCLAFTCVLLCSALALPSPARAQDFAAFLQQLERDAVAEGLSPIKVQTALRAVRFLPSVIRLDRAQPETSTFISLERYVAERLTPERIAEGRSYAARYRTELAAIERETGVPAAYILALWGVETSYGRNMGKTPILSALATLAYEGRRRDFFKRELMAYLEINDKRALPQIAAVGSWAGAMGQCQFMPTSYLKYAKDGDGDGKINIWSNMADVFASIANYLKTEGWTPNLGWGAVVTVSADLQTQITTDTTLMPAAQWQALGVGLYRAPPVAFAASEPLRLIQPKEQGNRALLVTRNFDVLRHWNKSDRFATLVGQLAEAIAVPHSSYKP